MLSAIFGTSKNDAAGKIPPAPPPPPLTPGAFDRAFSRESGR